MRERRGLLRRASCRRRSPAARTASSRDLTLKDKCFRTIEGMLKDGCRFAEAHRPGSTPEKSSPGGSLLGGALITADVLAGIVGCHRSTAQRHIAAYKGSRRFDVIVLDPPWATSKRKREVRPNQKLFDYAVMTEKELRGLGPLPAKAHAHVFCWTTQKFLPVTLRLFEAWGVRYVLTMVWHKPGGFQPMGLPQFNCEFVVYGRIGSPTFTHTKAFSTCFEAPRGKHSEKPNEFYDVIRDRTEGMRIDMFARKKRDGFHVWGNET